MSVEGRVVVITGATGGLGKAAAQRFAEEGARLALLSSNQQNLDDLVALLSLPDDKVLTVAADLRTAEGTQAAAQAVTARFDHVDVVLHVVGGWAGGKTIPETDSDDLRKMLDQNVWTTWNVMQAFLPLLTQNQWGRFIAVSSPFANAPAAKGAAYAAAKAAQEALVLAAAKEIKAAGVTANIIQVRTIDEKHERDTNPSSSNANWTTPEEIAAAMVYLCSEEAKQVNGERVAMYGG